MTSITTIDADDLIADSRTVINTNFSNLNSGKIETSALDTDSSLGANSDSKIATQKATKGYVDGIVGLAIKASGVGSAPATSITQQITHTLGRIPTVIRLDAFGGFTSSASSNQGGGSHGTYTSSGNRCIYLAAGAGTLSAITSTSFAIYVTYDGTLTASGVIQNLTSTTFDIVWTVSADASALKFMWEAN